MAIEVHVKGTVERGRFADFLETAEDWKLFRERRGWVVPRILQALSGEMNEVRMIFRYSELAEYEKEEASAATDRDYASVAQAMPFEGSLWFAIYSDIPALAGPGAEPRAASTAATS